MDRIAKTTKSLRRAVALGLAMGWGSAGAADIYLCAGVTAVTMPDGMVIPMWGYALDDDGNLGNGCGNALQVPGPLLSVPPGDTTLTVHLRNDLPVATSLVMPGQAAVMSPTFFEDAQGRRRVYSMTHETASGTTGVYTWSDVRPGSYIYHSGTHVAVQVQMGLYGAMRKDHAMGMAYAGVPYDGEVSLFYSEIDPVLHGAVADGSYGDTGPTSTFEYHPKYFLVNGAPHDGSNAPLSAAGPGQRTLLRMHNMGLRTVLPTLLGQHLSLIAEDGNPYPYPREQYSVMLAAGKTQDALFTPIATGTYAVFDRSLNLSNAGSTPGGQYSFLHVAAAAPGNVSAVNDDYLMAEDDTLVVAAPGVLGNDTGTNLSAVLLQSVTQGSLALAADGSFTYTPAADFNGVAQFIYRATDGTDNSAPATVSITVTPVNDAPVTVADAYDTLQDTPLSVAAPGVLANDSDIDSAVIEVNAVVSGPGNGSLSLAANGGFTYTPNAGFTGDDSFTYTARDGEGAVSNASTVTISVAPVVVENQPPVAQDDHATTKTKTAVAIPVLANDADPDGSLVPATVTIVRQPNVNPRNQAVANANGTITFTPHAGFRGSETFEYTVQDNEGAVSNRALVRVDVVK